MLKRFQPAIVVFLASIVFVCSAQRARPGRELARLPAPVQKTIRAQMGDAKLDSIDKNTEDGDVTYDVEITRGGKERGFTVGADGELLDEEVFLAELPLPIQQTIQKYVGAGTLGEIDRTNEGGVISYDVEMTKDGKTRNFSVDAKGVLTEMEYFLPELPLPLQAAVKKQAGDAKLDTINKVIDGDDSVFEVEIIHSGKTATLSFDPEGNLLSTEEDVNLADTPAAVQAQINTLVGSGKLTGITKTTEGTDISYDVEIKTDGTSKTVSIGSDGKVIPDEASK